MALFPSDVDQNLFYLVYFVWFLFTFFIERVVIGRPQREGVKARGDRGSALLIFLSVFLSIVVAFGLAQAGVGILPDWVFDVGVFMMVAGIIVREWAVATLRSFFSFQVRVLEEHRVVESGPYRLVRHPAYSGSILTIVGIGLALRSWAAAVILLAFCALAYGYRMRIEERTMVRELGEPYAAYMQRTKRLVPFML